MIPRILIGGTSSGCGKTTVVCAILQAMVNRRLRTVAFKSGPDYIDPMFHSKAIGAESSNLDLFLTTPDTVRYLLHHHGEGMDFALMEGAMGFYDGIAMGSDASAWMLAKETHTPVILVANGQGSAVSLCAVIHGFQQFQPDSHIQGVILNRVSPMLYPRLKKVIEERCGIPVYGFLPSLPECSIESRHLGLMTAAEIDQLKEKLNRLAQQAENTIELDNLLHLAQTAPAFPVVLPILPQRQENSPRIAVAKDEAFCFYYQDNLELLQDLGAELTYFSPLHDDNLPPCDGLYLGGGYPELYAPQLSEKKQLMEQMKTAIYSGLPTIAECGGFLYLQQELEDTHQTFYPMCGVLDSKGYRTPRLQRFGYITMTASKDNLLCKSGESLPAHEFHYWDSTQPGNDFHAQKPQSNRSWECAVATETLYAGFPHFHFYSAPQMVKRFLNQAIQYQKKGIL
jgi:cobyrinic acid a,c-diamide synthase